jgi:hypothetical protein
MSIRRPVFRHPRVARPVSGESVHRRNVQSGGVLVLAYVAWIVTSALTVWTVIELRTAVLQSYTALQLPRNSFALVDQWSFALLIAVCLAFVIFAQWHIGRAVTIRILAGRLVVTALPTVTILVLAYLAQAAASR